MKTDFKSKLDLVRYYSDEENCKKLLAQQRWGENITCVHCGHDKVYTTNRGYKCASPSCYKKFSVISGTIFENTKIPLNKWFEAIFVISAHKKGISSHQLGRDISVSQKTAWFILHRVREMLREKSPVFLAGTTEVDETYVGGSETNKHQSEAAKKKRLGKRKSFRGIQPNDKTMVLGLVERGGKLIHKVIPQTSHLGVLPVIEKHIAKGSNMVTDEHKVYRRLSSLGYHHESVSHAAGEYYRTGGWHTNTIEGSFSLLKRGIIGIYHQVSPKHLQRYCDEFSFRYNTRKITDVERFVEILKTCGGRLTYNQLRGK
jgi:hypothetical protein